MYGFVQATVVAKQRLHRLKDLDRTSYDLQTKKVENISTRARPLISCKGTVHARNRELIRSGHLNSSTGNQFFNAGPK